MQTDEWNRRLSGCDPAGELTTRERELLAAMVEESMPRRRRRYARPIAATVVAAVALGGAGVAAAATSAWERWARKDPYVAVSFQLPSGTRCEYRVGNLKGVSPEVDQVVRDTLANATFSDEDVVNGAKHVDYSGNPLTDDDAYQIGLTWAVQLRTNKALAAHGLSWPEGSSSSGQAICS